MKARLIRIGWFAAVLFLCCPLMAAHAAKAKSKAKDSSPPPIAVEPAAPSWPAAELTIGIQTGDKETEGIGDVLVPVWNPGGNGLLFLNPRTAITDRDGEEFNLGVGYRQLLPKHKIILGANAFYDYRDTGNGSYNQWGAGVEMLSPWVDARANYYDPENKKIVVASQTETTSRQSSRTTSTWSDLYPEDHAIVQDYVVTRTLTTETFSQTYEQYQQPLGGYDLEIGLRLPLPAKPETVEAKVFGGFYDFDRDFGDDAQGWKARAELRLLSSLFLDAGVYENDDLTGSDWFAGARLSVPLDLASISQGRNPFSTARSRLNREPRDFSARLTEMVMRDPQIRLETSKFIENKALSSTSVQSQSTRYRQSLTLMPDVQFVFGDASAPGDGSAERPFATIQQGVDAVFGSRNVYVFNASGPYQENVVLTPDVRLWGSGSPIQGAGGIAFAGGTPPIVDGMGMGPSITMANRTTVSGFFIRNTGSGGYTRRDVDDDYMDRLGIYAEGEVADLTITHNVIAGNSVGVLLYPERNFNLLFANNVVRDNSFDGMRIIGTDEDGLPLAAQDSILPDDISRFSVLVHDSQFIGNGERGADIRAQGYDYAFTELRNSAFSGNGWEGAYLYHRFCDLSMVLGSGLQANGNGESGMYVQQRHNTVSLANLSGLAANNNDAFGIQLRQESDMLSIGVVGMPQGLGDILSGLVGLPDELDDFFRPCGSVVAGGNGESGVAAQIESEGMLSLGAFFDVVANNNAESGLQALSASEDGVAVALAGSSQNLSELLQLGANVGSLFDVDLPISIPGGGQFQANDNEGSGLLLLADGGMGAISAVLGAETSGNASFGTGLAAEGDVFSLAAAIRLDAHDNDGSGLALVSHADDVALGLIADVDASDNGARGIDAEVISDGVSALLALSTDALRPISSYMGEEYLGAPLDIPGQPFGPVVANGNGEAGIYATVIGDEVAAAAFLDTQANGNLGHGFDVFVESSNGTAVAAFLSSDLAYDIAADALDVPDLEGAGLGGIQANNNAGCGILSETIGYDSAVTLLGGVQANDNGMDAARAGFANAGILAWLTSEDGSASAYLVDVEANGNSGHGIYLDLESLYDADVVSIFANVADNGHNGFDIAAHSLDDDVFVLLADVDASGNDGNGIDVQAIAYDDAAVAITASDVADNGENGIFASVLGGYDADLFIGDAAIDDLDDAYDFVGDVGFFGDMIPTGEVVSSGNGEDGIHAELVAEGDDASFLVSGSTANDNLGNGIWFSVDSTQGVGNATAQFLDVQVLGNVDTDLEGTASADSGDALISSVNLDYSGYDLTADSGSGNADIDINP